MYFYWCHISFFPPLEKQIDVEVAFDDGSIKVPPLVGLADEKPFNCSEDFPLKITFHNRSQTSVSGIRFSIEGRAANRSTNLVKFGDWRETDTIIPAGYSWKSCWAVSVEEGYEAAELTYDVKIIDAVEASGNAEYRPAPSKVPADKVKNSQPEQRVNNESPPKTETSLATIADEDWDKIGMGCACSFSEGASDKVRLIAGGDGLAFFRLNKKEYLCSAPDIQTMFDGPVTMSCRSAKVQVTPFGQSEPGFDGHSTPARIQISDGADIIRLTGKWGCYC